MSYSDNDIVMPTLDFEKFRLGIRKADQYNAYIVGMDLAV